MRTPDGFFDTTFVLSTLEWEGYACTLQDIRHIVEIQKHSKPVFELKEINELVLIRLIDWQLHNGPHHDLILQQLWPGQPLPGEGVCVCGTSFKHLKKVMEDGGLRPIGDLGVASRTHVQFAAYHPNDPRGLAGLRSNAEVAIYVDIDWALREGVPFFVTPTGSIQSPGSSGVVSHWYFIQLIDVKSRPWKVIWHRDWAGAGQHLNPFAYINGW